MSAEESARAWELPGWPLTRTSLNVSSVLPGTEPRDWAAAVTERGYAAMECWWPFSGPIPGEAEKQALLASITSAGIELVSLNLYPGDRAAGQAGLIGAPDAGPLEESAAATFEFAGSLGCRWVNVLFGVRTAEPWEVQRARGAERLTQLAALARNHGVRLMLEPVSAWTSPGAAISTCAHAGEVIDAVASLGEQVGLCFDVFHLFQTEGNVLDVLRAQLPRISHVQVSDFPGRRRPGNGVIDFAAVVSALRAEDYQGYVGLEYVESVSLDRGLVVDPSKGET